MKQLFCGIIVIFNFASATVSGQKGPPSPEALTNYDKAYAEYQQKLAEVQEKNKRTAENNQKLKRALEDGAAAYNAKNYELAIEKFDEGFRLDPDYIGSAPVFLNNKAAALRILGAQKYNAAVSSNQNPSPAANQYFLDSVATYKIAQELLDRAEIPTDENMKRILEANRSDIAAGLIESYRLLVLTDETRIYEAIAFFENYIKTEANESRRRKAEDELKELKTKYKINY